MSVDVAKNLERAKKYLEKNKLQDAVGEYQAILSAYPNHQESIQALGDLYTRLNDPVRAAQYYGMLFDRLADSGDNTKASAIYQRFLKAVHQSPERMMRFALLLQRQNRRDEAIDLYNNAGESFMAQNKPADALACWDKIAALDPDNPARHVKLGEVGEKLGRGDVASRGFLRAGQLTLAAGQVDAAIDYFARAHRLAPGDRSTALFYAQALLSRGSARDAVRLLDPMLAADSDAEFLSILASALMADGQLDRAQDVLDRLFKERPDAFELFFDLSEAFFAAGQDARGVEVLDKLKQRMFAAKRISEFLALMDRVADAHARSIPVNEFCGRVYDEQNRESKYFNYLTRLFDLYYEKGEFQGASNALDRIVDIDPYDSQNSARLDRLQGKVDASYLRGVAARLGRTISASPGMDMRQGGDAAPAAEAQQPASADDPRARQTLEDLIVQAEIFLQYSLQAKAIERLQKIAEMFPGEEDTNTRLRSLYDTANWQPPSAGRKKAVPVVEAKPVAPAAQSGTFNADTLRDLGKVSEITRLLHRQSTPKSVLAAAVGEIGKYLRVSRCAAVFGPVGQPAQLASEYFVSGLAAVAEAHLPKLYAAVSEMPPESTGEIRLDAVRQPLLKELGIQTVLAVPLTDRESQSTAGMLMVGDAAARQWKPNEGFFLQAVGDQVVIGVNHTKLRSLMRNLAVADEKTGLLGRGSYQDCLLSEANRMKAQNTPLSLVILSMDKGLEALRQYGEAQLERHMEQLARTLQAGVRQNDLAVKYTNWSVAFILPDTRLADALALADKLRKVAAGLPPPWNATSPTFTASVSEAVNRPDFDSEDIITDLINRAEFGLEESRKKGGDSIQSL